MLFATTHWRHAQFHPFQHTRTTKVREENSNKHTKKKVFMLQNRTTSSDQRNVRIRTHRYEMTIMIKVRRYEYRMVCDDLLASASRPWLIRRSPWHAHVRQPPSSASASILEAMGGGRGTSFCARPLDCTMTLHGESVSRYVSPPPTRPPHWPARLPALVRGQPVSSRRPCARACPSHDAAGSACVHASRNEAGQPSLRRATQVGSCSRDDPGAGHPEKPRPSPSLGSTGQRGDNRSIPSLFLDGRVLLARSMAFDRPPRDPAKRPCGT